MAPSVYIAGPMTGIPAYNYPAFVEAANAWRAEGWEPSTPFDANSQVWRRHYGRDFDPYTDKCDYGDPILGEMLVEDLLVLIAADRVAFLPGWRASKGATFEHSVAVMLGKPCDEALTFCSLQPESVCAEADRIVAGTRQRDYGHPFDDFSKIGRLWAPILGLPEVTPEQVALCMAQVKVARLLNSPGHHDSMVDICGYAKTYQLVRERRSESHSVKAQLFPLPTPTPDRQETTS